MKNYLLIGIILMIGTVIFAHEIVNSNNIENSTPSFEVDYENDQFLMNGEPFRYISGSFHYFRAFPETWRLKLRTMRAAGLNAVSTYVEWSLHNPKDGVYNWEGIANIVEFIQTAKEEDLYVILRPGPYICAERDLGGFPYWLLNKYPEIQLRTADHNYLNEIRIWYSQLMTLMEPHLFGNGGPIIMVQIENEYGSFAACDVYYREWLKAETDRYVGDKAVLFTTDGPGMLKCGSIPGVFATIDFGTTNNVQQFWAKLRQHQPQGPLVNSEFYPGWLTHWQEELQTVGTNYVTQTLKLMLKDGASVNFYMFFGGTNFGFTAGANDGGLGHYNADITSYDYDAPMTEAGDPTPKYMAIRDVISQYLPLPNISVPVYAPKMNLGITSLRPISVILSSAGIRNLATPTINFNSPNVTFEYLNQYSGLVLYETIIPNFKMDPVLLTVDKLRDRALVYVDRNFVGVLSRENNIFSLPITVNMGNKLQILVENQGRINYNIPNDFKGIRGDVHLGGEILYNWNVTGFPLEDYQLMDNLIKEKLSEIKRPTNRTIAFTKYLRTGPTVFYGEFEITQDNIYDTYLDPSGWGKGLAFVNGFNLGRYWPVVGPQITLYVPKEILLKGTNKVVLLEYQHAAISTIEFTDIPKLDSY